MDLIAWFLALIGISNDHTANQNALRAEVARLNAEVAGEVLRTLDILAMATPRLTRLASQVSETDPEIPVAIANFLEEQRVNALQILKITEDNKDKMASADGFTDWNKALHLIQEWRVTASRITPWVKDNIDRFDAIFLEAGIR